MLKLGDASIENYMRNTRHTKLRGLAKIPYLFPAYWNISNVAQSNPRTRINWEPQYILKLRNEAHRIPPCILKLGNETHRVQTIE